MSIRSNLISFCVTCSVCLFTVGLILLEMEFDLTKISLVLTYSTLLVEIVYDFIYYFNSTKQNLINFERIDQFSSNDQEDYLSLEPH